MVTAIFVTKLNAAEHGIYVRGPTQLPITKPGNHNGE